MSSSRSTNLSASASNKKSAAAPPHNTAAVNAAELSPHNIVAAAVAAAQKPKHLDDIPALNDTTRLAPRTANDRLARARADFAMSHAQLGHLIGEAHRAELARFGGGSASATKAEAAPSSRTVAQWEAGLARVPDRVDSLVSRLHECLRSLMAAQAAREGPPVLISAQEYPRQESMVGPEFQALMPKMAPAVKSSRRDELLWSPRVAAREGVDLEGYLTAVRRLIDSEPSLSYDEEAALDTLRDLNYSTAAALEALEVCCLWRRHDEMNLVALRQASKDGGRVATVHSVIWLHRLASAKRRRAHTEGEGEAMLAGLLKHGKDLMAVQSEFLHEKTVPDVVDLYFRCGAWRKLKEAQEERQGVSVVAPSKAPKLKR